MGSTPNGRCGGGSTRGARRAGKDCPNDGAEASSRTPWWGNYGRNDTEADDSSSNGAKVWAEETGNPAAMLRGRFKRRAVRRLQCGLNNVRRERPRWRVADGRDNHCNCDVRQHVNARLPSAQPVTLAVHRRASADEHRPRRISTTRPPPLQPAAHPWHPSLHVQPLRERIGSCRSQARSPCPRQGRASPLLRARHLRSEGAGLSGAGPPIHHRILLGAAAPRGCHIADECSNPRGPSNHRWAAHSFTINLAIVELRSWRITRSWSPYGSAAAKLVLRTSSFLPL